MELKELASVAGKGGLYRIVKPGKTTVLLESLDEAKTKLVASTSDRLSLLEEISIYTTTKKGTATLGDVLRKIKKDFDADPGVDGTSEATELKSFMKAILPEYDEARVYTSDIKKLVRWYGLIQKYAPEILEEEEAKPEDKES